MKSNTPKPVKNKVRIIYQPRAGKAKTLTRNIAQNGTLNIDGGTHTVNAQAMGMWKGKTPWCRINADNVQALPWFGTLDPLSPAFLNEAVENHYASECIQALDAIEEKKDSPVVVWVMLGVVILIQLIAAIWVTTSIGSLHDALVIALQTGAHTATTTTPDVTVAHA